MKKLIALPFISILTYSASAQITGKKLDGPITLDNGTEVKVGDTIYLGKGTDRKGDFVYFYQPPNFLASIEEMSMPRNMQGRYVVVKHFKDQSTKKAGKKIVAVVNFGALNYVADLDPAIESGEVLAINQRKFGKEAQPVAIQQSGSVADELKKLKDLLDSGAITKEEYDAAKKKILEKQ